MILGEGDVLSPQQLDDLHAQCREYCYDMNPESTLNIGALTLTKIKDAFAIMKNLVLEALNKSSSSGGGGYDGGSSSSSRGGTGTGGITEDALNQQISDLKSLLLQRDNEIAILVNMVKKGKTVEDVGMSMQRSSRLGGNDASGRRSRDDDDNEGNDQRMRRVGASDASQHQSNQQQNNGQKNNNHNNSINNSKSYQQQQLELQREREKDTQELIIKRHLFGVPPPSNATILDDAAASFEYFCSKCNLNVSLNENKEILKEKIASAKATGERANHSRSTINYLKSSIEAIRRERVLQKLHGSESKKSSSGEDDEGDDGEEVETEEEVTYRRAIDQEKVVYKESFDRLRVLKPEIENIRKVTERG